MFKKLFARPDLSQAQNAKLWRDSVRSGLLVSGIWCVLAGSLFARNFFEQAHPGLAWTCLYIAGSGALMVTLGNNAWLMDGLCSWMGRKCRIGRHTGGQEDRDNTQ